MTEAIVAKGFPALQLLCNVGAAVVAFRHREWQRGFDWLAAAIGIACVAW